MTSYELIAIALLGLAPLLIGISAGSTEYKRQNYRLYTNKKDWWRIVEEAFVHWFQALVAEAACVLALSIVVVPLYYLIWGV